MRKRLRPCIRNYALDGYSVGFGDYTPAQFTVNSNTQVTATVPSGAKTGPVGIQTQGGIAISTQTFTVTQ